MLYDRVMKNLQKRIKHMNSFINARLKENWENLLKIHFQGLRSRVPPLGSQVSRPRSHLWVGSRVSGLGYHLQGPVSQSQVLHMRWDSGLRSRVPPKVPCFGSHFSDMSIFLSLITCLCQKQGDHCAVCMTRFWGVLALHRHTYLFSFLVKLLNKSFESFGG